MASGKYFNDGYVLAFKLGGKATLPKVAERNLGIPEPPVIAATQAQLDNGKYKYMSTCMVCHGALVVSGGVVPDLRRLPRKSTRSSKSFTTASFMARACRRCRIS
jgi:quinohemoprotein ethanol dehydrogenase